MRTFAACLIAFAVCCLVAEMRAAEPITLATVNPPPDIAPDEPNIQQFSLERAAQYLDTAALDWQKEHACTSCHTMMPYLMARPALNALAPQSSEVRTFFEDVVRGKREAMPSYECKDLDGAVAIGIATAMAINDRYTDGKLHPLTREALDRMWRLQRDDGSWQWPFRDTPPLKLNEHYGVTFAAIGVGMAPDSYAKTPQAMAGLQRIRQYLQRTKAVSLHQKAIMLWASAFIDELLTDVERTEILSAVMSAQRSDGGWSLASFVDNTDDPTAQDTTSRAKARSEAGYGTEFLTYIGRDGTYKSSLTSDGYATGFAIFVARKAKLSASDARLKRGISWLERNQRESGRWFTPSQAAHSQHLIANAGAAYAILALEACGKIERPGRK